MSFNDGFLRLYVHSLRLLPSRLRLRHADEMVQVVSDRMVHARSFGRAELWRRAWRELADVLILAFSMRSEQRASESQLSEQNMEQGDQHNARGAFEIPIAAAFRRIARRPAFGLAVVLILALAGGAAAALFSVVDAILIKPLPYNDSRKLAMVWRTVPNANLTRTTVSYPDYLDYRAQNKSFRSLAVTAFAAGTIPGDDGAERVDGSRVSGNLFATLGNTPLIGRTIVDADDAPGVERTIVLSYDLWRRRFGADSSIIDKSITMSDRQYRVVGVMTAGFAYPSPRSQFWVPLQIDVSKAERDANFLTVIGRLQDNVSTDVASAEFATLMKRQQSTYPTVNAGSSLWVENRQTFLVRDIRQALLLLSGAVAVLLAIACANVGNLHVVRSIARGRELSVRRSLGASRMRLGAEQLAESVLLGGIAGALAVAVGAVLVRTVLAIGPAMPRSSEIVFGVREVLFAVGLAMMCSLLTGVLPYVGRVRRIDANVGGSRSTTTKASYRLQHGLVALQLSLTLMLVVGAALLGQSFYRLMSVPRGFEGEHVLIAKMSLPNGRYQSQAAKLQFYDQLTSQLAAVSGVEAVSGTWALPFSEDFASSAIVPADRPVPEKPAAVGSVPVRDGFFHTLGVPLRHGREFGPEDRTGTAPVAMVNETLARTYWGTTDVIGKELRSADPDDGDGKYRIVGVVADMKRRGLDTPTEAEIYFPHAQSAWTGGDLYLTVRVSGEPAAYVPALRRAVKELDALLPLTNVGSLDQFVSATVVQPRFRTLLIGTFAVLASLLSLVGVYAALSFVVAQRKQEIAVRGALGATPLRLFAAVLRSALIVAALGVVAGLAGAFAAVPLMQSVLFGIQPFDATTFVVVASAMIGTVALASLVPARRAARTDPMRALRES